jgi:hypothetical protein
MPVSLENADIGAASRCRVATLALALVKSNTTPTMLDATTADDAVMLRRRVAFAAGLA